MVRQRELIKKWNNTYGSTVATGRTIGLNGYQWPNLPTIIGHTQPQANPHLFPFFVNLGHHPNTGREVKRLEGDTPSVDSFLEVMERTKREVKMALEKTNVVMEQKFNVRKKTEIDFQKGDLVWVDGSHYNDGCPSKKLSFKRMGPFPIIQKVGDAAYELKIPNIWRNIHPVINRSALKPYFRYTFEQQAEKSNMILTPSSGQKRIQEVEKILDSRWRGERLQYLVK